MPKLLRLADDAQLIQAPIYDLRPLRHLAYGRVLLLGDAGHATTPNMAQGASMAVEDAAELVRCLQSTPAVEAAFQRFEQRRLPRTRRIIRTSWQLGRLGQLESPWLAGLRNAAMRLLPAYVTERQLTWLYHVGRSPRPAAPCAGEGCGRATAHSTGSSSRLETASVLHLVGSPSATRGSASRVLYKRTPDGLIKCLSKLKWGKTGLFFEQVAERLGMFKP